MSRRRDLRVTRIARAAGDSARAIRRSCSTNAEIARFLAERSGPPAEPVPLANLRRWPVDSERIWIRGEEHWIVFDHATPWYALYSPLS